MANKSYVFKVGANYLVAGDDTRVEAGDIVDSTVPSGVLTALLDAGTLIVCDGPGEATATAATVQGLYQSLAEESASTRVTIESLVDQALGDQANPALASPASVEDPSEPVRSSRATKKAV